MVPPPPLITPSPFCNQIVEETPIIFISSLSIIISRILYKRTTDQEILIADIVHAIEQVIINLHRFYNFDASHIEYINIIINLFFDKVDEEVYWTVIAFASLSDLQEIN